jgi:hypothetical protein
MTATGPKISSLKAGMSAVTSASTVGRRNNPSAVPPVTMRAPASTLRSTMSVMWSNCDWLMIGPRSTWPRGSPTVSPSAILAIALAQVAPIGSATRCRPVAMHTCPWWAKLPYAPAAAAASTSASSSTTNALLPPSSETIFLKCLPAASDKLRPTGVEPVNEIMSMFGSSATALPSSLPLPGSMCSTPDGRPASSNRRAITTPQQTAVSLAGFRITALPVAGAGATERSARISGKFHGAMAATTPYAIRRARLVRPGWVVGSSVPHGWLGSATAS